MTFVIKRNKFRAKNPIRINKAFNESLDREAPDEQKKQQQKNDLKL